MGKPFSPNIEPSSHCTVLMLCGGSTSVDYRAIIAASSMTLSGRNVFFIPLDI